MDHRAKFKVLPPLPQDEAHSTLNGDRMDRMDRADRMDHADHADRADRADRTPRSASHRGSRHASPTVTRTRMAGTPTLDLSGIHAHTPTSAHSNSHRHHTPPSISTPPLPSSGGSGTSSGTSSRRANRPPPLSLKKTPTLDLNKSHSQSPPLESPDSANLPGTPFYEKKAFETPLHKVVLNQKSPTNMISARSLSQRPLEVRLESRTLSRRNKMKLTLEAPLEIPPPESRGSSASDRNNNKLRINLTPLAGPESGNSTARSEAASPYNHDPERKTTAEELIENIQHLELGVEYQIPIKGDDLVLLKKLGSGNSGTVSKVLHLPTQKVMARKIIHLDAKEMVQSQIVRELRIMHECDSPFIIDFYGAFLHEGDVVICMEYVDCGSFDKILKLTGPLPDFMLKHVAYSVLSGLNYLYEAHRIIHRDVKPSNVLLDSKGNIKLCDFGVSKELNNSIADTFVGTSTYMSPERIQGGVYSVKGDVWSLGLMLYELASGRHAFSSPDNPNRGPDSILDLLQSIVNESPPKLNPQDGHDPMLCEIVSMCLRKEKDRPDPRDLIHHEFFSDFVDPDGFRVSQKYRGSIKRWAKNVRRVQKGKAMKS